MLLFLIAVEPLAIAIQQNRKIHGIQLVGKQNITTCRYADDCTLTLTHAASVKEAFHEIHIFEQTSGLRLNKNKSQGLHCRPCNEATKDLPDIPWTNQYISILGVVIGTSTNVERVWRTNIRTLKEEMKKYGSYPLTYNAKAIFLKTEILSKLTYMAQIYPLPVTLRNEITNSIENFMTGNPKLKIPIDILARPLNQGGYRIPNIALYCDLLFLKTIAEYCKYRKEETTLPDDITLLVYNIGLQLSNLLTIPARNHLPHASHPSKFYSCALAYCRKYKLTFDDLTNFKIFTLYQHQTATKQTTNAPATGTQWENLHLSILPNNLGTFNYRSVWKILPVTTQLYTPTPDGPTLCVLCKKQQETFEHLSTTHCSHPNMDIHQRLDQAVNRSSYETDTGTLHTI